MSKRKILRPLLFLFGIGFIVLLLWRSRETLAQTLPAVNWIIFLLSVGIAVGLNFLIAFLYQKLIHKYGINIEYGLACRIHIYTQVAKYIPGKVWALWYQSIHLNATHATATVLFANLDLTLILITLVSGIAAMLLLFNLDIGIAILVILLAILGAIIQGRYCHTFTATGYLVSFFKKLSTKLCGCSEMISVTFLWGFSVLFACGYVFSNFLMLNAVFGFELSISAVYIGYLGLAWIIGVLSIISPGGMGVRELSFIALSYTLSSVTDTQPDLEMLSTIAVTSRAWLIVQEISGAMLLHAWSLRKNYLFRRGLS